MFRSQRAKRFGSDLHFTYEDLRLTCPKRLDNSSDNVFDCTQTNTSPL